MKKIVFCYFSPDPVDYTPLDLGYIVAIARQKMVEDYSFLIHPLSHVFESKKNTIDLQYDSILEDVDKIAALKPKAVFIFLESVLWSRVYAFGRAKKIACILKARCPNVFIGIQSYKIYEKHIDDLFSLKMIDAVILSNPENSFLFLKKILAKEEVGGVIYENSLDFYKKKQKISNFLGQGLFQDKGVKKFDKIPSPYLQHIFDDFLIKKQKESKGEFVSFITSSRGCCYGCYYCYRSIKFEKVGFFSIKRFYDEIEYLHSKFRINRFFILDDAFLCSKEKLYNLVLEFKKRKEKNESLANIKLFIMSRPEPIDDEIVDLLAKLNVLWVQIGLQTIKPDLQIYMNRKMSLLYFKKIAGLFEKYNIKLHLDIIVGLPNDAIEFLEETIDFAIGLNPKSIQVKQFYLNPSTRFFADKKKYGIEIEDEERDFDVPFVARCKGKVDEKYHKTAQEYIYDMAIRNSKIGWKIRLKSMSYMSKNYTLKDI